MTTILRSSAAKQDLKEIVIRIGRTSLNSARRFLEFAERTFELLAIMPGLGAAYPHSNPRLPGLRHFPVHGFQNHVVFYIPLDNDIEVVRVVHGARDLPSIVDEEN